MIIMCRDLWLYDFQYNVIAAEGRFYYGRNTASEYTGIEEAPGREYV